MLDLIREIRYRQNIPMTAAQYDKEPLDKIEAATFIWALDAYRAKLEAERRQA